MQIGKYHNTGSIVAGVCGNIIIELPAYAYSPSQHCSRKKLTLNTFISMNSNVNVKGSLIQLEALCNVQIIQSPKLPAPVDDVSQWLTQLATLWQ